MIVLRFLAILVYCKKYSKYDLIESVTLPIASFFFKFILVLNWNFVYILLSLYLVFIFSAAHYNKYIISQLCGFHCIYACRPGQAGKFQTENGTER